MIQIETILKGPYNNLIKPPEVVPHCNCPGVHIHHGLVTTQTVKSGGGLDKPTIINKEGVCKFCEHFVLWKVETWDKRSTRGNRRK